VVGDSQGTRPSTFFAAAKHRDFRAERPERLSHQTAKFASSTNNDCNFSIKPEEIFHGQANERVLKLSDGPTL